jgi:hypothetical protein
MPTDIGDIITAPTGTEITFLYQHPNAPRQKLVTGGIYSVTGAKTIIIYDGMFQMNTGISPYYTIVSSGTE